MKMWPDETDKPRVVKSGLTKGSIVNYWPPKTERGMARLMAYNIKTAAASGKCPTCGQGWPTPIMPKRRKR